jgi:hypothetical protein
VKLLAQETPVNELRPPAATLQLPALSGAVEVRIWLAASVATQNWLLTQETSLSVCPGAPAALQLAPELVLKIAPPAESTAKQKPVEGQDTLVRLFASGADVVQLLLEPALALTATWPLLPTITHSVLPGAHETAFGVATPVACGLQGPLAGLVVPIAVDAPTDTHNPADAQETPVCEVPNPAPVSLHEPSGGVADAGAATATDTRTASASGIRARALTVSFDGTSTP